MAPTTASTVVGRPAAQVFAYATGPARFREWQQGLIEGHLDPPGPDQISFPHALAAATATVAAFPS